MNSKSFLKLGLNIGWVVTLYLLVTLYFNYPGGDRQGIDSKPVKITKINYGRTWWFFGYEVKSICVVPFEPEREDENFDPPEVEVMLYQIGEIDLTEGL